MTETVSHEYKYVFSVRFHGNQKAYSFGSDEPIYAYEEYVVVETARGLELGQVISEARLKEELNLTTELKPILRKASEKDLANYQKNKEESKDALRVCNELIQKLNLDMNLISAEYTLDRSKIIFVYVADERVDFRELLKDLASQLKCRIELKQIGPRDKAKMIGGIGPCGLETCFSKFLNNFDVVSINMAKNQLLALNISKLSGQCGKLMCCLKYEDENYKEMRKGCPKMNEQIDHDGKRYRVTSMNVITQQAKLENREEAHFLPFEEAFKEYRKKEKASNEETKELSE
ncbi:MAG: stage 0 sporulation protein [Erysipelotrichaceae bacterium]|nr:stage 0 sporulation protein [Erysipelotrichaceae bacterium]